MERIFSGDRQRKGGLARSLPIGLAGGAVLLLWGGILLIDAAALGPLSQHMGQHILLMNVAAPLLAMASARGLTRRISGVAFPVAAASVVQLALLWAWHSPAALQAALQSHVLHLLMQASLFGAALWFWLAIVSDRSAMRWRSMLALLLTGKLFCLIGVLLVFAPRMLYAGGPQGAPIAASSNISDQHLAGLLMIVACPPTYVLAGIIIAARWLREASGRSAARDAVREFANRTDDF